VWLFKNDANRRRDFPIKLIDCGSQTNADR
jgi:hypothetical protein